MADNIAARGNFIRWERNGTLLVDRSFFGAEKVLLQQRDEAIEALRYLMQQFDGETWQCPRCGHAEDTATMDSAEWLRDWLKTHNA